MDKRLPRALAALALLSIVLAACHPAATQAPTSAPAATQASAATSGPAATAAPGNKPQLSIIWFAWQPCQALTDYVKTYPDADVSVRCVPIAQVRRR